MASAYRPEGSLHHTAELCDWHSKLSMQLSLILDLLTFEFYTVCGELSIPVLYTFVLHESIESQLYFVMTRESGSYQSVNTQSLVIHRPAWDSKIFSPTLSCVSWYVIPTPHAEAYMSDCAYIENYMEGETHPSDP